MITPAAAAYLQQVKIPLRLACVNPEGWPLVLSLWFQYQDGRLYCATQGDALVVQYLRADPRCGFEIAADQPPYCGLRGRGRATIDARQGIPILTDLLHRYLNGTESPLAQKLLANSADEVAIIITPLTVHTWDYTNRMQDSVDGAPQKPCPG